MRNNKSQTSKKITANKILRSDTQLIFTMEYFDKNEIIKKINLNIL